MAADPPVLVNGWWTYTRDMVGGTYGSSHLNPSAYQINNAYKMRTALQQIGYGPKAIAGVIGCGQVESGLSPGAIQKWSVLPNNGESLSDVTNANMLLYYNPTAGGQGYGLGLLQWDRYSSTYHTNDLLGWMANNGYDWYDGTGQITGRLAFEYTHNSQYNYWRLNYGNALTWDVYKDIENSQFSHYDAGECAIVWTSCWELSSLDPTGRQYRRDNGNFWYQYFIDHPTPPPTPGTGLDPWMYFLFTKKRRPLKNVRKQF